MPQTELIECLSNGSVDLKDEKNWKAINDGFICGILVESASAEKVRLKQESRARFYFLVPLFYHLTSDQSNQKISLSNNNVSLLDLYLSNSFKADIYIFLNRKNFKF
jgi:hypothetical protein